MNNKIKILLDLYGSYYPALIDTVVLLKSLRKLPADMQLEPKMSMTPMGPTKVEKRVTERIVELERDQKVLSARVEAIEEELKSLPGGEEALKKWHWIPLKEK